METELDCPPMIPITLLNDPLRYVGIEPSEHMNCRSDLKTLFRAMKPVLRRIPDILRDLAHIVLYLLKVYKIYKLELFHRYTVLARVMLSV